MNVKKRRLVVGAEYPAGSYLTPNGKVLTPGAIAQMVALLRKAAGMGETETSSQGGGGDTSAKGGILQYIQEKEAQQTARAQMLQQALRSSPTTNLAIRRAVFSAIK